MTDEIKPPIACIVEASFPISAELIGYILVGEFEGNPMASWVGRAKPVLPEGVDAYKPVGIWYDDEDYIVHPTFAFTVEYDDPLGDEGEMSGAKTIRLSDIQAGLKIMAEKYPEHFANLTFLDNADAITYDVAFQCIVLGEVVYG